MNKKALKLFQDIFYLATCDETLFHDGIDKEIASVAREGIKLMKGEKK